MSCLGVFANDSISLLSTGGCQKKEPPSKMAYLVYNDYK